MVEQKTPRNVIKKKPGKIAVGIYGDMTVI